MLDSIVEAANNLPTQAKAFIVGLLIALLRVVYDKKETKPIRIFMEGLVCGCLAMTAGWAVTAMGLSEDWAFFASGVIGYIGSFNVRVLVLKFLNKKV